MSLACQWIPLPVSAEGASLLSYDVGRAGRGPSGVRVLSRQRAGVRRLEAPLVWRPLPEALWLQDLATGLGEVWPLTSHLYGSRGRAAALSPGATLDAAGGRWGGALSSVLLDSLGELVSFPAASALGVTVLAWVQDGGAWYLEMASWLQSAAPAAEPPSVALRSSTAGVVTVGGSWATRWTRTGGNVACASAGGTHRLSDVLVLPRALDGVLAATRSVWAAACGQAPGPRGAAPQVVLSGALVDPSTQATGQATLLAHGEVDDAELTPANRGAGLAPELRLRLLFEEV